MDKSVTYIGSFIYRHKVRLVVLNKLESNGVVGGKDTKTHFKMFWGAICYQQVHMLMCLFCSFTDTCFHKKEIVNCISGNMLYWYLTF